MHNFKITTWSAWDISELYSTKDFPQVKRGIPKLCDLSAMVKRRMPKMSKCIYELLRSDQDTYSGSNIPFVFVSKNAELNRTFKIIRSFKTDVSPTQFSMSVHNAIAGLLSVITKNNSCYTVIDSMSGTIETALIEAISLLSDNEFVKVIYFDEDLPDELVENHPEHNNPMILELVIEKGKDFSLDSDTGKGYAKENFNKLFAFLDLQNKEYKNSTNRLLWTWTNNAKN